MKRLWMLCAVLTFGLIPQVIFAAEAKPPNRSHGPPNLNQNENP